jgi:hypothetical protein
MPYYIVKMELCLCWKLRRLQSFWQDFVISFRFASWLSDYLRGRNLIREEAKKKQEKKKLAKIRERAWEATRNIIYETTDDDDNERREISKTHFKDR